MIHGRSRELGQLRTVLDRAEPSLRWVVGLPGVGKTALVREAIAPFRAVVHRAPPLSEPQQRKALADTLNGDPGAADAGSGARGLDDPPSWEALFSGAAKAAAAGRPFVLVVDDAHRWTEARSRYQAPLAAAVARARKEGHPLHVLLVAPEVPAREGADLATDPPLRVAPLTFRGALPLLPGGSAARRLRAWAVFGGLPGVLTLVDRDVTVGTNVRRLLLAPGAPLADRPLHLLERTFQTPARYAAILSALAGGEGDWGVVHRGVPDLTASGQAGPYLKRLEEIGLVEARRSLDASPRTRSRRYRVTDPFVAFWYRLILPLRERVGRPGSEALHADVVRPGLPPHVASVFAQACRDFMAHDAVEQLGANARELGSLWGGDVEIPVAGILGSGAAFYGAVAGSDPDAPGGLLDALGLQIRETRYGFGRERRLRLVFVQGDIPPALQREAARRTDAWALGLDALAGDAHPSVSPVREAARSS